MKNILIHLPEATLTRLRALSKVSGHSVAKLIRHLIDHKQHLTGLEKTVAENVKQNESKANGEPDQK
jgi:predicted DNA-binding protein